MENRSALEFSLRGNFNLFLTGRSEWLYTLVGSLRQKPWKIHCTIWSGNVLTICSSHWLMTKKIKEVQKEALFLQLMQGLSSWACIYKVEGIVVKYHFRTSKPPPPLPLCSLHFGVVPFLVKILKMQNYKKVKRNEINI